MIKTPRGTLYSFHKVFSHVCSNLKTSSRQILGSPFHWLRLRHVELLTHMDSYLRRDILLIIIKTQKRDLINNNKTMCLTTSLQNRDYPHWIKDDISADLKHFFLFIFFLFSFLPLHSCHLFCLCFCEFGFLSGFSGLDLSES